MNRYYGSIIVEKTYYLIFEYASNGSLRDYLRSNFIENERMLFNYSSQIANALEYLHRDFRSNSSNQCRSSIAHRDMKSDNILILSDHRLVLSDFAMSIHLDLNYLSSNDQQQVNHLLHLSPLTPHSILSDGNTSLYGPRDSCWNHWE